MREFNENELIELLESRGRERALSLSEKEKSAVRETIIAHMEMHPVRKRSSFNFGEKMIRAVQAAVAAVLAVLLGGSVSYAAEGALPGDLLYPVKTRVNEEIAIFLAVSDEKEAQVYAELATKRIEEAEKLATAGRLDSETRAMISEKFNAHAEKSDESAKKVEASEKLAVAVDIRSDFESVLLAHTKVLAEIDTGTEEGKAEMEAVLEDVRIRLENIVDARASIETKLIEVNGEEALRAAEIARAHASAKIAEARKFLDEEKVRLSREAEAEILAQIDDAGKSLSEGELHYGVSSYAHAFSNYKRAIREAEGAKLLVRAAQEFNIKIRANGFEVTASSTDGAAQATSSGTIEIKAEGGSATTTVIEGKSEDGNAGVKIEIGGSGVRINSKAVATSSDGGSASVKTNQQINARGESSVRISY